MLKFGYNSKGMAQECDSRIPPIGRVLRLPERIFSEEGLDASLRTPEDQRVYIMRSLICIHRL